MVQSVATMSSMYADFHLLDAMSTRLSSLNYQTYKSMSPEGNGIIPMDMTEYLVACDILGTWCRIILEKVMMYLQLAAILTAASQISGTSKDSLAIGNTAIDTPPAAESTRVQAVQSMVGRY